MPQNAPWMYEQQPMGPGFESPGQLWRSEGWTQDARDDSFRAHEIEKYGEPITGMNRYSWFEEGMPNRVGLGHAGRQRLAFDLEAKREREAKAREAEMLMRALSMQLRGTPQPYASATHMPMHGSLHPLGSAETMERVSDPLEARLQAQGYHPYPTTDPDALALEQMLRRR